MQPTYLYHASVSDSVSANMMRVISVVLLIGDWMGTDVIGLT